MEKRNILISLQTAKEWFKQGGELRKVALQAFTEEEITNSKPTSWEEYCENIKPESLKGYWVTDISEVIEFDPEIHDTLDPVADANIWETKELAKAAIALNKLLRLAHAWQPKFSIIGGCGPLITKDDTVMWSTATPFGFANSDIAVKFGETFKDLLKEAMPLLRA